MNVLVVEDDPRVADFLVRGLKAEGYAITLARDGTKGLELARAGDYGLIILDWMLPGLNGIEITQALRSGRVMTPILMLTAMGALTDRVQGLRVGADDYLVKPFAFEELLARMEALHRRAGSGGAVKPPESLVLADLILDRNKMQVHRAGKRIELTAKELAVLELLLSAPQRVFSRERILANVWGASEDPLTNVVDVYIRRLRVKIDEGFDPPLIRTVRGFGYKIDTSD
jgi:DNA-binding response OmpR family regulator